MTGTGLTATIWPTSGGESVNWELHVSKTKLTTKVFYSRRLYYSTAATTTTTIITMITPANTILYNFTHINYIIVIIIIIQTAIFF